ncbi:MAG: dihydroorotate dehydrogenase electron transfer subunit [Candidatus Omnitrophota bacterium]|nr:dihydroorotate dehydrogenase electron transfer subunit [Candidatus Omnitrophota bacterium]
MADEVVKILDNRKVNEKYYKLSFCSHEIARGAQPGQFLHIQINPTLDPFWRRPFSFYRVDGDEIEILYEILGHGTAMLAQKQAGEVLKVMGPLGKPFRKAVKPKKRICVAGGVGLPPLLYLAECEDVDFFLIGAKSRSEVMPDSELEHIKGTVMYSTNDGSYGVKGYVTVLLEQILKEERPEDVFIQTCGPMVMMQAVRDLAEARYIKGEASVDETMACGLGVCLGCMVKTHAGWLPSCTEGPVFDFSQLQGSLICQT